MLSNIKEVKSAIEKEEEPKNNEKRS